MNEKKRKQKLSTPRAICQFHKAGIALSEQTFILRSAASSMLNWLVNYGVDCCWYTWFFLKPLFRLGIKSCYIHHPSTYFCVVVWSNLVSIPMIKLFYIRVFFFFFYYYCTSLVIMYCLWYMTWLVHDHILTVLLTQWFDSSTPSSWFH